MLLLNICILVTVCLCQGSLAQSNVLVVPSSAETSGEISKQDAKPDVYSLHVLSTVQYRYAHTEVSSRVANVANVSKEIVFSVLLPETAFISGFLMEIDGNVYKAHVKEKEEAKQEYDDAIRAGRTAGHVAQSARNSNRFTVSVNIEPQNKVTFNLTYEELLKRELGLYNLAININPGQIVRDVLVEVRINETSPITKLHVPPLKESNEILDESPKDNELAVIEQPSNSSAIIRWSPTPEQQIQLNKDGIKGQLTVQYDVDRTKHSEQILVNEGYFVHFFAPENLPTLRKHVTFVLDVSGSMAGRKMEQLIQAMETILSDLKPSDYFSLIIFSTSVEVWDPENPSRIQSFYDYFYHGESTTEKPETNPKNYVFAATKDNINKSTEFIRQLRSHSSTNIYGALVKAIEVSNLGQNVTKSLDNDDSQQPEPMIIFLTDGQANVEESNPDKITKSITTLNKDLKATIFCLSLGNDADLDFLKKLSLRNSGFARKIYEASDTAIQLRNFYKEVASPLLKNVIFNYPDNQVEEGNITETNFNTFFSGSEIVIAGRLKSDNLTGSFTAKTANGTTTIDFEPILICPFPSWPIPAPEPSSENATFMERLWAYLTIQQLLEKDAQKSEDNSNSTDGNKDKALQLALKYSFVTPVTSLVVVKPNDTTSAANTEKGDEDNQQALRFYGGLLSPMAPQVGSPTFLSAPPAFAGAGYSAQIPVYRTKQASHHNLRPSISGASFNSGFGGAFHPHINPYAYSGKLPKIPRPTLPANPCIPSPCGHNSQCKVSFPDAGSCSCLPGFTGNPYIECVKMTSDDTDEKEESYAEATTTNREEFTTAALEDGGTTVSPMTLVSLTNVSWLRKTAENETDISFEINGTSYLIGKNKSNDEFQSCATSVGGHGHCRHLQYCAISVFTDDYNEYIPFKCIINEVYAGVCCPDSLATAGKLTEPHKI